MHPHSTVTFLDVVSAVMASYNRYVMPSCHKSATQGLHECSNAPDQPGRILIAQEADV